MCLINGFFLLLSVINFEMALEPVKYCQGLSSNLSFSFGILLDNVTLRCVLLNRPDVNFIHVVVAIQFWAYGLNDLSQLKRS